MSLAVGRATRSPTTALARRHLRLLGRKAGTQPGFDYSDALKRSRIIWDARQLDRWLANPNALVPGNKMVVQLASDPRDRRDIIAFLVKATSAADPSATEKFPSAP